MISFLNSVTKLMRPHQYLKNFFIFAPLFFAGGIFTGTPLLSALLGFISFSLVASSVYIINDYQDIEDDKKHPKKRHRPLASGAISKNIALILSIVFMLLSALIMLSLSVNAFYVLSAYVVLNLAYSLGLKHVAILDVTIIAIGFVMRLFVGSLVTDIPLSSWIVLITFLLALFLALAKRRDDVLIFLETGQKMRKVVDGYNLKFLDTAIAIMASVVIVSYIMYTTFNVESNHSHPQHLYLTTLFVILGVLRYMQITFVLENSGSPTEVILKDNFIRITILSWIVAFAWIIY